MLRKPQRNNTRDYDGYKEFRRYVLRRDKYKCQMPGCNRRCRLQVHHIVPHSQSVHGRLHTPNSITLCKAHHDSINKSEHHYIELFSRIANQNEEKMKKKK